MQTPIKTARLTIDDKTYRAELAVAEFESKTTKRLQLIGVCANSGIFRPRLILLDTMTQHRYQVPARYLPRRMLHQRNA